MSIVIYYSNLDKEWLRTTEPVSIYNNFVKKDFVKESGLIHCGASKKYISKVYGIKSIYDYEFNIEQNKQVRSSQYDQNFFNDHLVIRSVENKFFSFTQQVIFFTEESSLEMSTGIFPFLENNNITERCSVIPGTFDIGKWFRPVDFAFYLNKNYNSFKIEEDEIYQYISFDTDEKIIFKKFMPNQKLFDFANSAVQSATNRRSKNRPLESYYKTFGIKNKILKEIKENLI